MEPQTRTLEQFVDDLITDGRKPREIHAVAMATRWASRAAEAKTLAEGRLKPRPKKRS